MSYITLHLQVTVHVALISPICALVVINTTSVFHYTYTEDYGITIKGVRDIIFMVKARNDAHLALSRSKEKWQQKSYEVVIGGWNNQRSVIRKCDQCLPKASFYHTALNQFQYKPFWIRWDEGLIRVGNGSIPLEDEFMQWEDTDPHEINHLGIATGWGAIGSWVFDFAPPVWASWEAWNACDTTCDLSYRRRMRKCLLQQLEYGIDCYGPEQENQICDVPMCPIDGGWTEWEAWSTCSRTCGPGLQSRQRECANPFPEYGGEECPGDDKQIRRCDYGSCAVDGNWSLWSNWTKCTVTCGGGLQERNRSCDNPPPQYGGRNCSGSSKQRRTCSPDNCPIDGKWSPWTDWSFCTTTCGGGIQNRTRTCNNPKPQYGGRNCTGNDAQSQICSSNPCPIDGRWSIWTDWSSCTATCGGGTQGRTRTCNNPKPNYGGRNCTGHNAQSRDCSLNNCPIDGRWSSWTDWSLCTTTCGGGIQNRTRTCNSPKPQYGGRNCTGSDAQSQICSTNPCPIDGRWSMWTNWTSCNATCGGGMQYRARFCNSPAPKYGGNICGGHDQEMKECAMNKCPVAGEWTAWQSWSQCSNSCGNGLQTRSRQCNNPAPQFGGSSCQGHNRETITCNIKPCPVNGEWSGWNKWSTCTTTCGNGSQSRSRDCNNPSPQNGGQQCEGNGREYRTCSVNPCPVDGNWSNWGNWSDCSSTCGEGFAFRERECNNPAPLYGGQQCSDNATESKTCFDAKCPIAGEWSQWNQWSGCSRHCGYGVQTRDRLCNNPPPQYGGENCRGNVIDERKCIEVACPVNGNWTDWSPWSPCSRTCNIGIKERQRNCTNPRPQFGGQPCEGPEWEIDNCFEIRCPINGGWAEWSLWTPCTVSCNYGVRHKYRSCTHPKPRYGGTDCVGNDVSNQTCAINDCPKPRTIKKIEFRPTEAPGAVGIGMIGLSFCFVLMAFFVTLDLVTLGRHIAFMKRNLAHYCGKYKACAPKPLKRRKSRKASRKYLHKSASLTSDDIDNNTQVNFEDEVLSNGINHHGNHVSYHENKALINDDEGGGDRVEINPDEIEPDIRNDHNMDRNDQPNELHRHKNIRSLYKRQIYDFDSTRL